MSPSPEHELDKEVLGRFVETLAEELAVKIYPLGSTTFKRPEVSGAEPDKCFYIRNIALVHGKRRLDLTQDPAPDLVMEIDVTSSSQNRLQVYADGEITRMSSRKLTNFHHHLHCLLPTDETVNPEPN